MEFGGLGLWVYLGGYGVFHLIRRKQFSRKIAFATFPCIGEGFGGFRMFRLRKKRRAFGRRRTSCVFSVFLLCPGAFGAFP